MSDKLLKLMQPPDKPAETRQSDDWSTIEGELGTELPTDYKWFVETYGTGKIANFVMIWNPFTTNEHHNLVRRSKKRLEYLRKARETVPQDLLPKILPYPLFPEQDGLLPFGETIDGDTFYWQTKGQPDEWHIVINQTRSPDYEKHPMNLTTFLYLLIRGTLLSFFNETDIDISIGFKKSSI